MADAMRAVLYVVGFALAFWLAVVLPVGFLVFLVPQPQSEEPTSGALDALSLLFWIALVAGAVYGWRKSRRLSGT